jgi:hypothetical protein
MGQSATSLDVHVTAALPTEAEIRLRCNICRNVPISGMTFADIAVK